MKTYITLLVLIFVGLSAQAQLTEGYSKNRNAKYNIPSDTSIVFPIRGNVIVTTYYYATMPTTDVEYYIYDSTGRVVYYEIQTTFGHRAMIDPTDRGYAYYMSMQGNYMAKRNPEVVWALR
jgi:hypothetical protein